MKKLMNDHHKPSNPNDKFALNPDMCDNHSGSSHAHFSGPVHEGVARVIDVDKHLRRIFSEGSFFNRRFEASCCRCGVWVGEGDMKVFHNGFGMSVQVRRCWCVCCHSKVLNDSDALSVMITNRKLTWGMEEALASTVPLSDLLGNCFWSHGCSCLCWAGEVNNDGYGLVVVGGVELFAHRVSFIASGKVLMPGCEVRHVCHQVDANVEVPDRRCIKPEHLRAGTHAQNMRDRS